jgi:hypothetical protein
MPVLAGMDREGGDDYSMITSNTSSQTDPAFMEGRGSDTPPITGIGIVSIQDSS